MEKYDVIVVGGGTAGTAAAIAAARRGVHTLLIEKSGALGGTSTLGLVTPLMKNHVDGQPLNQGINLEIVERYRSMVGVDADESDPTWFDPVLLSIVLDEMVRESGAEILFEAVLSGVTTSNSLITSVEVVARGAELDLSAPVVIDATGDAAVARMAGCPLEIGNEEGRNQPMSLRFIMGNVAVEKVADGFAALGVDCRLPQLHVGFHESKESPMGALVKQAVEDGVLQEGDLGYFQFFSITGRPNSLAFNCPRLSGYEVMDPRQVSQAYSAGRQKILRIVAFLQKYVDGFGDAYVSNVAPLIGIRESVRIVGAYTLTEDDYQQARHFPDGIAASRYPIDIHNPSGVGTTLKYLPEGVYHEIPYRCLLPQGVSNLLVTGRCISASFAAQAAIRIIPNCRSLGEAAGIAGWLAVKDGVTPAEVAGEDVKAHM